MTFTSLYNVPKSGSGEGHDVEEVEEQVRKNIKILSRQSPLLAKTLDLMMSHSNNGDMMTFEMVYEDAMTEIKRSRKSLEVELRQCVEEVAGNISEHDTIELKRGMTRALERHDKSIDRLFERVNRLDQRGQDNAVR